jgi:hypothetical protein
MADSISEAKNRPIVAFRSAKAACRANSDSAEKKPVFMPRFYQRPASPASGATFAERKATMDFAHD